TNYSHHPLVARWIPEISGEEAVELGAESDVSALLIAFTAPRRRWERFSCSKAQANFVTGPEFAAVEIRDRDGDVAGKSRVCFLPRRPDFLGVVAWVGPRREMVFF